MPTPQMTRERTARSRGRRDAAASTLELRPPSVPSRSPARVGLAAVLLGIPMAVLAPATGPYDDPKAWALPILLGSIAVAWLAAPTRSQDDVGAPPRGGRVVRWLVLASIAWGLVMTVASIAPVQSILGSFGRGVGMLTMGGAALLFFLIQREYRTLRDVRSLIDVALLGSVPVCLLAVGQAVGWDPLPRGWDPAVQTLTIRSTFGTHVFLGTYLVVLVPLTMARLAWAFGERLESGGWPPSSRAHARWALVALVWVAGAVGLVGLATQSPILWWLLVPWGVVGALAWTAGESPPDTVVTLVALTALLVGQLGVIVLSRGRGAFLGTLVGLGVAGSAYLIRRRAWTILAVACVAGLALVAFLVLLNWPGSALSPLRSVPLLSRLADVSNVKRGSPGWVRLQLWRGISEGWWRQLHGIEVVPGLAPRVRSFVGYGPETQLIVLEPLTSAYVGRLVAGGEGWQARYVFDRSHNALLDLVVTQGLVGASLWVLLLSGIVVVGVARLRAGATVGDLAVRVGALGAVLGHTADAQVGMTTPTSLALFWIAAGLATANPWAASSPARERTGDAASPLRWRGAAVAAAIVATCLVGWVTTRWLFSSMAYAAGVRHGIAGQLSDAYREFRSSVALAPWLPLPAESAAYTALRLATVESVPSRRAVLLHEAEALLTQARSHAIGGPGSWALSAQIAFAEARAGEPSQLAASRDAFAAALRLRPDDPRLLAQSAWVWLESGDALRARRIAQDALAREPREWMAWAVLARVSRALGDAAGTEQAASRARELAPREARPLVEGLLR